MECVMDAQVWDAHKHLVQGMESGEVQPLPWTVFSRDHAQEAFRFLAGGTHMGKVLVQVGQSEEARRAAEAAAQAGAQPMPVVLPRSNVPEEAKPLEEVEGSDKAGPDSKSTDKDAAPKVCAGFALLIHVLSLQGCHRIFVLGEGMLQHVAWMP